MRIKEIQKKRSWLNTITTVVLITGDHSNCRYLSSCGGKGGSLVLVPDALRWELCQSLGEELSGTWTTKLQRVCESDWSSP